MKFSALSPRALVIGLICLLSSVSVSFPETVFRSDLSRDAAEYLFSAGLLPDPSSTGSRLEYAGRLDVLVKAAGAALSDSRMSPQDAAVRPIRILEQEFETELALIALQKRIGENKEKSSETAAAVGGRAAFYVRGFHHHPFNAEDGFSVFPSARVSYRAPSGGIPSGGELSFRSAADDPPKMKVDEANVTLGAPSGPVVAQLGRFYFILGHLGLIGDNNFDAFEGGKLDLNAAGAFKFSAVYARLSSTNYPRTARFESADDYLAARVSRESARGNFEVGANALLSGIASEDGVSVDVWWRTPWRSREFVAEVAAYRPTKSGIIEEIDPYEPRFAAVCGFDAVKSRAFNVFIQLGDVQSGFTPMATSLAYSAQDHLYFDHDTRGIDAAFTYFPRIKEATGPWRSRPDRTLEFPRHVFYELNLVYLWNSSWEKSQARYILRHSRPVSENMKIYLENTVWDREETPSWPARGVYNESRIYLALEI